MDRIVPFPVKLSSGDIECLHLPLCTKSRKAPFYSQRLLLEIGNQPVNDLLLTLTHGLKRAAEFGCLATLHDTPRVHCLKTSSVPRGIWPFCVEKSVSRVGTGPTRDTPCTATAITCSRPRTRIHLIVPVQRCVQRTLLLLRQLAAFRTRMHLIVQRCVQRTLRLLRLLSLPLGCRCAREGRTEPKGQQRGGRENQGFISSVLLLLTRTATWHRGAAWRSVGRVSSHEMRKAWPFEGVIQPSPQYPPASPRSRLGNYSASTPQRAPMTAYDGAASEAFCRGAFPGVPASAFKPSPASVIWIQPGTCWNFSRASGTTPFSRIPNGYFLMYPGSSGASSKGGVRRSASPLPRWRGAGTHWRSFR